MRPSTFFYLRMRVVSPPEGCYSTPRLSAHRARKPLQQLECNNSRGMIGNARLLAFIYLLPGAFGAGLQPQIPSVESFTADPTQGPFNLSPVVQIIVDSTFANQGSPSVLEYANTFRADLVEVSGFRGIPQVVTGSSSNYNQNSKASVIYLTLGATANHSLYNGKATGEGYDFEITSTEYVIRGVEPIGAWWGTRTLLQQVAMLKSSQNSSSVAIPAGSGSDTPGWEVRGFMLDAGRHWFEASFLSDLCTYASFFKLNEFHIHASDNFWDPRFLYGPGWKTLYSGFRFQPPLGSPVEGLVPMRNESWPQDTFAAMQSNCAAHGVTIIPEIDTPGHSLVISQWKPELALAGTPDELNLSYPETIPTIQSIWEEFLPWFDSSEVSIGADEYNSALADEYIAFVNEMADYIHQTSGKSIRVWGTYEPSNTSSISKNVTIQHWDFPADDIPVQLLQAGYDVINTEQAYLYLEGKTPAESGFPQELNQTAMWSGAPNGAGWAPNIFSPTDPSNNTSVDDPHLRGSIMALWNDWGNNATTQLEIYYQLAPSLAVFSEKTWSGSGVRDTALTQEQFDIVYPILNAMAPGQNLNRVVIPKQGNMVYNYSTIPRYPVETYVDSVGPPYTLKFSVQPGPDSSGSILFSGNDSTLYTETLTFESNGQFFSLNYTLPEDEYTTVEIHATREYTYAVIGGDQGEVHWYTSSIDIWGDYMAVVNMSFAAPSRFIGDEAFGGSIRDVTLTLGP